MSDMLLVDDLLAAPFRGLLWVFRRIHEAAEEEIEGEQEAITGELRELYMMLETGRLGEAEFDAREHVLLDRLDAIRERDSGGGGREEEQEADEEEGEENTVSPEEDSNEKDG